LPSIRKHGAYMTPRKIEEILTDPDTIIGLAE
jgi:prophage antirepressor-like protein